jgi:CubicO group peptidase (beta-lactamase class C family)
MVGTSVESTVSTTVEGAQAVQSKVQIEGTCSDRFASVYEAFAHNLATGQDIGASVAVLVDGEPVVDLWGGHFDGTYTRPWDRHTIAQGFSSTKTVTALCALVLADRGELDLDAPVATYWPEFAAEGKGSILVRQLLGHTAALCGWDVPMTHRDLYDWEKSTTLLARQAPMWEPGRTSGYHGYTHGHLIGEVVRRVTGMTIGRFLSQEIAGPLGVADDYYIGVPEAADSRVSLLIQGAAFDQPTGNRFYDLALFNPRVTTHNTWALEWRRAELPAMNGHGNGRGLATLQSVLAAGGANGVRLLSDASRERVLEQQSDGPDLAIGVPCRWGMGFALETALFPGVPQGARAAWWGGNGGSLSFIDLDARMAIGFVPNRWISGPFEQFRSGNIVRAAYEALNGAA